MDQKPIPISDWLKLINEGLSYLGVTPPPWLKLVIGLLFLAAAFTAMLTAILLATAKIKEIWSTQFNPKILGPEERQRAARRRDFADYLKRELEGRDQREKWHDEKYAELEAEVQADGRRRGTLFHRRKAGVRREPSLSLALERSNERLILLEGDPGSGKSVAMRHVAHELARAVIRLRGYGGKLPVYINLKEIKRSPRQKIDHQLIGSLVLSGLNRADNRTVADYLDQNFDKGIIEGDWVFLFDSFDEIPDILSSIEIDSTIIQYSTAIADFLGGLNRCRGVVASRSYRGPSQAGWRSFRILELTPARQMDLIQQSLDADLTDRVRADLIMASDDVRRMARNPLLLGLLCAHVKAGHAFPQTAHETISRFIDDRFARDEERVKLRLRLDRAEARGIAEATAFSMTANSGIGLNPNLDALATAVQAEGFRIPSDRLVRGLEALDMMRLGRMGDPGKNFASQDFTFTHRRFQEYFATCVVIDRARSVPAERLLADARWRETAVVLLQTGESDALLSIIEAAASYLPDHDIVPQLLDITPAAALRTMAQGHAPWPWVSGQLHILSILQAGAATSPDRLPGPLRLRAAALLKAASTSGDLLDRKLALEVAAVAPQEDFAGLLKEGLATQSQWLSEVVYAQAARLLHPVPEIYTSIRAHFARLALSLTMKHEYQSTRYYVSRLPQPRSLLSALQLARVARPADLMLFPLIMISFLFATGVWSDPMAWSALLPFLLSCPIVGIPGPAALVFALLLRITACSALIVSVRSQGGLAQLAALFCGIYAFTWLPSALFCIRSGRMCAATFWPIVQLYPLIRIVWTMLANPVLLLVIIATLAAEIALIQTLPADAMPPEVGWVGIVMAVSFWSLIIGWVIWQFICWQLDRRRLRPVLAATVSWRPETFRRSFAEVRTIWGRGALLEDVENKSLAGDREAWERLIGELLEAPGRKRQFLVISQPRGLAAFSGGLAKLRERQRAFRAEAKTIGVKPSSVMFDADRMVALFSRGVVLKERDLLYKLLEKARRDALYAVSPSSSSETTANSGPPSIGG